MTLINIRFRFVVLGTLLLLSKFSFAQNEVAGIPVVRPESVGMSTERLARIDDVVKKYVDADLVAGAVTLVARKGQVVQFKTYGHMDAENTRPMRKDAMFRIASLTKPMVSVGLMMLWEQGNFQLSDPVSKYIPSFENQLVSTTSDASGKSGELVPVNRPSTIRDLLSHTAGLAGSFKGNTQHFRSTAAIQPEDTLEIFVDRLAGLPLNYHPGEDWQYGTATNVVGRLVEIFSGQKLNEFMRENILDPLEMHNTKFFINDDEDGRLMSHFRPGPDSNKIIEIDPGTNDSKLISRNREVVTGAGGWLSTVPDYLRFQTAMLNGGELDGVRLLSPSTVKLMTRNHTGDLDLYLTDPAPGKPPSEQPGPGNGFGLGWAVIIDSGAAASPLSEGSFYWTGATHTIAWVDPEQDLIGILMTQLSPHGHIRLRQDFLVSANQAIIELNE